MKSLRTNNRWKVTLTSFIVACIMAFSMLIPSGGVFVASATVTKPQDVNDLGYLGRGVNLLREIDKNDKSDDLLAQDHLKVVIDSTDLSDFEVSKDPISASYGQGYSSRDFLSLAKSMGVDLSTKATASSNFAIGTAKMEAGFSTKVNSSDSSSMEILYTSYNYQKYLDTWTLNWDNGGIKGNVATLRNHLRTSVYGALTDSLPQYSWSPADFFEEFGTHIIVSYKRGGEYTVSVTEEVEKECFNLTSNTSVDLKGSENVSSFGEATFEEKMTMDWTGNGSNENKAVNTTTYSRGSSKGQLDTSNVSSINSWGDGVDDANAQVLSSGLTLIAMWDLLPSQFSNRKAELQSYYNEQIAQMSNDLLNKFVYKTTGEGDFDFSGYDAVISSASQLNAIRNNLKGNYVLACDIDISSYVNWEPIGSENTPFEGTFDGNGNTISGLNINKLANERNPYVGLFGYNTGTIKNLALEGNIDINSSNVKGLGGIAGYNAGTIENCRNSVVFDSEFVYEKNENKTIVDSDAPTIDTSELFSSVDTVEPVTVSEIPDVIERTMILDLRSLDSNELNKTITLSAGAKALRIIGDPSITYKGLNFFIENAQFDRFISLDDVNFTYTSENGAISTKAEKPIWIISEGDGNSISTDVLGIENAINVKYDLNIVGSASLSISGSKGVDGGTGATGKNGGNGGGVSASGSSGKTGDAGGVGGNGGQAVSAKNCYVNLTGENAELIIVGGIGGTGGNGGNGGVGGNGSGGGAFSYNGGNGGAGGKGGVGGTGGNGGYALAGESLSVFNGTVVLYGGAGGAGGNGGNGGNGGYGGYHWGLLGYNGSTGRRGNGGNGGNGGLYGDALESADMNITAFGDAQIVLTDKGVGNGGIGGSGYSGGALGSAGTISESQDYKNERVVLYTATSQYTLYDGDNTYDQANASVNKNNNETLISIIAEKDQKIVESLFTYHDVNSNKIFWIGLTRTGENINAWRWEAGSTFYYDYDAETYFVDNLDEEKGEAYTKWAEGEPDSLANKMRAGIASSGYWSAQNKDVKGGYVAKRRLDVEASSYQSDFSIGGIVGVNVGTGRISGCWNNNETETSTITVSANADCSVTISGIAGYNEGSISNTVNSERIKARVVFPKDQEDFSVVTVNLCDIAHSPAGTIENCKGTTKFEEPTTEGTFGEKVVINETGTTSSSENFEVETVWSKDRVRISDIRQTKFTKGEVLNTPIVNLTYSVDGKEKVSTNYSYKYDFSSLGITAVKLSYNYNGSEQVKYVPVEIVDVKINKVEINLSETKTEYQYGDEFTLPIIKQTMTDGMEYSFMADEEIVYDIPVMTDYGAHEITVYYENYVLTYDIEIAKKVVESTATQLKIQERTAVAGGDVVVQFAFQNMPEVKSILFHTFIYDKTKLEIVEGRWKVDGIITDWDGIEEMATFTQEKNGELNTFVFELAFKVKEDCPAGEYTVSCAALVNSVNENGYDTSVALEVAPGGVNVIDVPRGDFDGNGIVDDDDAIYLLRYTLFGGSEFEINQSGDVNGDDLVNSDDAIYLLRHCAFKDTDSAKNYPLYW